MTDKNKLKDRARDELFSHINRCGVLQAAEDEQRSWMDETMEYLGERYPDLSDADLKELYAVGMRFCRPAIPHGRSGLGSAVISTGAADAPGTAEPVEGAVSEAEGEAESAEMLETPVDAEPVGA
jgi:hypothetical protein